VPTLHQARHSVAQILKVQVGLAATGIARIDERERAPFVDARDLLRQEGGPATFVITDAAALAVARALAAVAEATSALVAAAAAFTTQRSSR
jgi:hypothetical protein